MDVWTSCERNNFEFPLKRPHTQRNATDNQSSNPTAWNVSPKGVSILVRRTWGRNNKTALDYLHNMSLNGLHHNLWYYYTRETKKKNVHKRVRHRCCLCAFCRVDKLVSAWSTHSIFCLFFTKASIETRQQHSNVRGPLSEAEIECLPAQILCF